MIFSNRQHAGQLLGEKLLEYKSLSPVILALPRGGVPVAAEIATILNVPIEVLIIRKIGHPFQSELAVGAICEDEYPIWSEQILSRAGLEPDDLNNTLKKEKNKIRQQIETFREGRRLPSLTKKIVIIVDDGLATGATMLAAVKYLKKKGVAKIIVAVPVGAGSSARQLRNKVDELIILEEREDLRSVGEWYGDFSQVSDQEVVELLKMNQKKNTNKTISDLKIPIDQVILDGDLTTFPSMKALIIFSHGSGSSRKSPRNQMVARQLNNAGFGTLLFDLLTDAEAVNRKNVFDIEFLSNRLVSVTQWLRKRPDVKNLNLGYFGASTGAAAAIQAAAKLPGLHRVYAIVSRGGRPDLAGSALKVVTAPTLLLVGSKDVEVMELNRQSQGLLSNSKLSIIPGATHLFEEPGTLDEVSKQAAKWFEDHLASPKFKFQSHQMTLDEAIERDMIGVKSESDFDRLIESIKDTRVVMLGEASHGTEEFYEIRSLISQRLIKEHGFKFIAIEGDWPDAYRLNKYIQRGEGESAQSVLMHNHRWPTWMWANEQIVKLAEWMKTERAGFYGLDVYSLFESMDEVVNYLKKNNLTLAQEIQRRYACFNPFESDEIAYARSLLKYPTGCENEVLLNLQKLLELRVQDVMQDGDELFSSQQNAHTVVNAEGYYRAMLAGDETSWNVRDGHMMETLDRLLERAGEGAKAIVWAHNTHIGDYRATDMKDAGYVNLGGLARQSYGEENVALIGFGTYRGEVLAGSGWGRPEQAMPLPEAREDSYEYHFHQAAEKHNLNQFYLLLEDKTHSPFAHRLGHRAVGVVYDPRQESQGNYVPTELSKRYDAFVFVDKTHALKSLHAVFVRGEFPETWPTGQ